MCTECLTKKLQDLTEPDRDGWYFTLRVGDGIMASGLLIVGPQTEVARFSFFDDSDFSEAKPGLAPENVFVLIEVLEPMEWVGFVNAYAAAKDMHPGFELQEELERLARSYFPRLPELLDKARKLWK